MSRTAFLLGCFAMFLGLGLPVAGQGIDARFKPELASVKISRQTPSADRIGPPKLPADESARRRAALASRIPADQRTTLQTPGWRFDVDRRDAAWALTDKSTGVLWTSDPAKPRFGELFLRNGTRTATWPIDRFDEVKASAQQLRLITRPVIDGEPTGTNVIFTVEPVRGPDGLRLAYSTEGPGPWRVVRVRLLDNALTVTDEDEGRVYVPHRLGIERVATKASPGSEHWQTYDGLSMAMCGLVKEESALLVNWDCVDTQLRVNGSWPDLPLVCGRRAYGITLEIESPQGACSLHPLGRGNYVQIAQAYRAVAKAKGWLQPWSEKRKSCPAVDRIFGATDFKPFVLSRVLPSSVYSRDKQEHVHLGYTFDEAAQCAEHWRNDLGIDRAFVVLAGWIHRGYDVGHPDVLPAAPECGGNDGLVQAARRIRACGYLFGLHDNYQDMYQDASSWGQQWLNKDSKGVAKMGGNWNGGQAWQVCAIKQVELAARPETNLPKIAQLFGPTIYFIDTVFAWGLVTCEDPAHPMTRFDDLKWKTRLCLLAKQHFGLFGSEEGREWAVPCADYLEGIFSHQTDSPPGSVIPLFPLVYSDCVQLMTHQSNRIGPGDEKKVADHILFAEMPLPRFGSHLYWQHQPATPSKGTELWSRGDNGWAERLCPEDRVIKNTWEVLSPLNTITAERPLSSHKFLEPDRLVQRTKFGDVTITVAYEKPARIGDNAVPAYGFIIESPGYVAFCATRYNGIDYAEPVLFTARSLDGKPIAESSKVRIYHGFGDRRIRLLGKEFNVTREDTVTMVSGVSGPNAQTPIAGGIQPGNLRCEHVANPLGIDNAQPRLSWIPRATPAEQRGQAQTAYQILVAGSEQRLAAGQGDLWDSGKVRSGSCAEIAYAGRSLDSYQWCCWKVRVWDKDSVVSNWSEPASWSMGILDPKLWQGKWLAYTKVSPSSDLAVALGGKPWAQKAPSPVFRKSFNVEKPIARATAVVCGLGYYDLHLDPDRPAFKHIIVRPRPTGDLRWVRARHESIYGPIEVAWKRNGGKFSLDLTVPVSATATVYVPAKDAAGVTEGGKPVRQAPNVKFVRMAEGAAVYEVGSGSYSFVSTGPQ